MIKLLLGVTAVVALTGCAQTISRNFAFSEINTEGLIAVGVSSLSGGYTLSVHDIDPKTCRLNRPFWGGKKFDYTLADAPQKKRFLIESLAPGFYVVSSASFGGGYAGTQIVNFDSGTIAFEVKSGEFLYVGDLAVSRKGAGLTGHDLPALKQKMADFSEVRVEPKIASGIATPFSRSDGGLANCRLSLEKHN